MAAVSAVGFVVIAAILCYGITAHLARREAIVTEKYGTFIKSNVLNWAYFIDNDIPKRLDTSSETLIAFSYYKLPYKNNTML
jgi:bacteriorhodopsin